MYALGIDIGSTATKVVIVDEGQTMVAAGVYELGAGTSGVDKALYQAFSQTKLAWDDIDRCVATGYGRQRFERADKQISELSCHARGMSKLLPGTRTVIDIGGQDAKALRLAPDGMLDNFVMNEKCAAGTGRFLDVMARVLETSVDKLGELDLQSTEHLSITSICTVFAESEVISLLSAGNSVENIVHAIHESVAKRACGLAKRVGISDTVVMTGGVARNGGVVRAIERELKREIIVPETPQLTGALGAALLAWEAVR